MRSAHRLVAIAAVAVLAATACSAGGGTGTLTPIKLQLQWYPQAQFAGYFAALDQGYYKAEGLDVTILPGAVDIVPATVVAGGNAQFGISWVPKALATRESGADIQFIGQVFQRSGTTEIAWKTSGIAQPTDWKGKKVGTWGFGNEAELYAAMLKNGIDPTKASDVTIVTQDFTMTAFLNNQLDAAEAMTYNEYAQVL
jgi:NitT/TauT family transport system substrate-binding protein